MTKQISKNQIANLKRTAQMAAVPLKKIAVLKSKINSLEEEISMYRKEYERYNDWAIQDFGYSLEDLMLITTVGRMTKIELNPKYFNIVSEETVDKNGRRSVKSTVSFKDMTENTDSEEDTSNTEPTSQQEISTNTNNFEF